MYNEKLKKGLYDYREEHDACGIGFYANMDNKRSHDIIEKSLEMLRRLDHRGGVGADGITGDGAGIMTEIPFKFFDQLDKINIPGEGNYAVGLFFLKKKLKIRIMNPFLTHISKMKVSKLLVIEMSL